MPREVITVQIGQCGIQVGSSFWDHCLREHALHNQHNTYDAAMSAFFVNTPASGQAAAAALASGTGKRVSTAFSSSTPRTLPLDSPISNLHARAVLVDMESGVLSSLLASPLGSLFPRSHLVSDVSGSGNNFAHGHYHYGPIYTSSILDSIRLSTEQCDSLQAFFLMHSLGGGTGSGLGTYILSMLADHYPDVYRFNSCVFPSLETDDVVTSPYNAVLAMHHLTNEADAVLPIDNEALINIHTKMAAHAHDTGSSSSSSSGASTSTSISDADRRNSDRAAAADKRSGRSTFSPLNSLCASVLTDLTCSMRFPGSLNVDLNEICTNLVPFPRLHFLVPSLAPLYQAGTPATSRSSSISGSTLNPAQASARIDAMFDSVHRSDHSLIDLDMQTHTYLACGLIARGDVEITDVNRAVEKMKQGRGSGRVQLISWNQDGFKLGLCSAKALAIQHTARSGSAANPTRTSSSSSVPSVHPCSVLGLSNTTAIATRFSDLSARAYKLYSRKAHYHHYLDYMEDGVMRESMETLHNLINDYQALDTVNGGRGTLKPRGERSGTGGTRGGGGNSRYTPLL